MRTDQYYGLNKWARWFVEGALQEECGSVDGAFSPLVASLHEYTFADSRVYREDIQAVIWSSGPCYFAALRDWNGQWVRKSLWSGADIANA